MHKSYAQVIAHAKDFNQGREIGLLKGASIRMSFFYCMHQLLCQKPALLATIVGF